jgi:hypothetical protein
MLTAAEFTGDGVGRICEFRAREAFRRRELSLLPMPPGTLLDEEEFRIGANAEQHMEKIRARPGRRRGRIGLIKVRSTQAHGSS